MRQWKALTSLSAWIRPNAQAYNDRALLLSGGLNQHDEALDSLKTALRSIPTTPIIGFNKGIILEVMERYDEALQSYGKATALNPSLGLGLVPARAGIEGSGKIR